MVDADAAAEFARFVVDGRSLGAVLGGAPLEAGSASQAVRGFVEFVDFCVELDAVLNEITEFTPLRERLVGFYSPLFEKSGQRVIRQALATTSTLLRVWRDTPASADEWDEINSRGERFVAVLKALEDGIYRRTPYSRVTRGARAQALVTLTCPGPGLRRVEPARDSLSHLTRTTLPSRLHQRIAANDGVGVVRCWNRGSDGAPADATIPAVPLLNPEVTQDRAA